MTPFARFRYWIAKPLLDELRDRMVDETTQRQREAYSLGRAQGEHFGQAQMLQELGRVMEERGAVWPDFTAQDLERAKKGFLH